MSDYIKARVSSLRQELQSLGIDGYIIPNTDEFASEYPPEHEKRLEWITGFTGSSGIALVLIDKAVVMTDGRYTLQLKNQVDGSIFQLADMIETPMSEWIANHVHMKSVIGFDPKLFTKKDIDTYQKILEEKSIGLKPIDNNLIDEIWTDKPQPVTGQVEIFPDEIAGKSTLEKRKNIAHSLVEEKYDYFILTLSDSICWLLNIRGKDIPYNPVVLSYAVISQTGSVDWFVNPDKLDKNVIEHLGQDVRIHDFNVFSDFLRNLRGAVAIDDAKSSYWILSNLQHENVSVHFMKDPCILPKACKTEEEQLEIRQAHIRDGLAVTRLLFWLEAQDLSKGHVSELSIEEKLEDLRKSNRTYRGPSFSTIAGWADHGAIIHYRATPETNKIISGDGFLLLDSGGQYEYGTTDITRTIVIGTPTDEMKDKFTRVLKGHIALARARFSRDTQGFELDKLARQPLLDIGSNYAHGTGHGVGCFLNVHEEASSISPRGKSVFKPGMLISNEPGYYEEGHFGIRHENLILCQEGEGEDDLYFDTVTCVPFDTRGINWELLDETEIEWLNNYHRFVFDTLAPFLDEIELPWLQNTLFPPEKTEETEEEKALNFSAYD